MKKIILPLLIASSVASANSTTQMLASKFEAGLIAAKKKDAEKFGFWKDESGLQGFIDYRINDFTVAQKTISGDDIVYTKIGSPVYEHRVSTVQFVKPEPNAPRDVTFLTRLDSVNGYADLRATYTVENIDGQLVRVQKRSVLEGSKRDTSVDVVDGNFALTSFPSRATSGPALRVPSAQLVDGKVIGWEMAMNGDSVRIYALNNGKVTKTDFLIKYDDAADKVELQKSSSSTELSTGEIGRLGFFKAEVQTASVREQTAASARGLEVESVDKEGLSQ